MAADSPDFTRLPAPTQEWQITTLVGQARAVNVDGASFNATATSSCVVFNKSELIAAGVNVVRVQIQDAAGVDYLDWSAPAPTQSIPPLFYQQVGSVAAPSTAEVTLDVAATVGVVVATVYGWDTPPGGYVFNTPTQPLNVDVVGGITNPLPVSIAATIPLPVSQGATIPGLTVTSFLQNLANAGTASVVGGVAGKTVTVYGWELGVSPTAANGGAFRATLQDSTGANIFAMKEVFMASAAGISSVGDTLWIPGGLPLPVGRGVQVAAATSAAGQSIACRGVVYYTQA